MASDILVVSGRAMLEALAQGTTDLAVLAELARGNRRTTEVILAEMQSSFCSAKATVYRSDPQHERVVCRGRTF